MDIEMSMDIIGMAIIWWWLHIWPFMWWALALLFVVAVAVLALCCLWLLGRFVELVYYGR